MQQQAVVTNLPRLLLKTLLFCLFLPFLGPPVLYNSNRDEGGKAQELDHSISSEC